MKAILLLFFAAVFAPAHTMEELKPETTGQAQQAPKKPQEPQASQKQQEQQKLSVEEMEIVKEAIQAESKEKAKTKKVSVEEKESTAQPKKVSVEEKESTAQPKKVSVEKKESTAQPEKVSVEKKESTAQPEDPFALEVTETEAVSTVEAGSEFSAVSGVEYVCDEGKSYTFYEPGNDPNHLCELDAGHTEYSSDWYALNDSSFCKEKIEELISQHNCSPKTE